MDEQGSSQAQVPTPTQNTTSQPQNNKLLFGILAYIGPLVVISYVLGKDDPFVKFHVKQGLVVFTIEILAMVLASMMLLFIAPLISMLMNLAALIFSILGIINVVQNKEQELPLIGQFSKHIPL